MENSITLQLSSAPLRLGHPWVSRAELAGDLPTAACVATLLDASGQAVGTGLYDPDNAIATWRRFSLAEHADFDADYIASAINDALGRRSDEHCQRLVCSDADYVPGLVVEWYDGILTIQDRHPVLESVMEDIVTCLQDACEPKEIVFLQADGARTLSGQNLKARWVELDGIAYRLDLLNPEKPRFFLDQREQHALVGSLCEGRSVLDGYAHSGAFALQAARNGAEHVVAVDNSEICVKAIGAQAQKNNCFVETIQADVVAFLAERSLGDLDAIILDPPHSEEWDSAAVEALHLHAFNCLPAGGLLATYCRSTMTTAVDFEAAIARAASLAGREARIFTRTAQPFDFPVLLNFPESCYLKGLILQVE
ncbi:RsmD family RNA methyltransferase [Coraliomargarita sp. SDUM461004]|uniref:RsmD family RNA methyltransferase n=1 Tax=Thalassobacterium sedimentorum TaxID=3041258 RepID=A0ABU1AE93_9BACT|nr:RsmD family RNA methyltransferase [Coraliomargarita sp. SDUM461004]MDQ8193089.1 RsmD family RNA methyltransferase [Coraliomargarita sp. SDUM461004]